MMKKLLLSIIIPTLLVTSPSYAAEIYNKDGNKLDLYGRVRGMHYFSHNNNDDGDKTYIRFGFKGVTQITDELSGYGQWEYHMQGNHSEADGTRETRTRLAFAGLKFSDYGSFDYGRNYGSVYDVEAFTDMAPEFCANSYTTPDNFMVSRGNGMATYRNKNLFGLVDGLNIALQYQAKNESDRETDVRRQNGDGVSTSAIYNIGSGVSLGAAYGSSNRTLAQKAGEFGKGDHADVWTTGLKFDDNGVYLAAMYAETRNMSWFSSGSNTVQLTDGTNRAIKGFVNKTQNVEITAQYLFDFGLRPTVGYVQSKGKYIEGVGDADLVKYIQVGSYYFFNKNMFTYVDYKINLMNSNNPLRLNDDNVVAVAINYQF